MKLRLITLLLLSCTFSCWAQSNEFLDRNQVLINVIQDEGVPEFSRFLERPDLAILDGKIVDADELHAWLKQYLASRTLVSGSLDDSSQSQVYQSLLRFEEQDKPLALQWVKLKGGEYYLRGVQAPMPGSSVQAEPNPNPKPEFVKNPNRYNGPDLVDSGYDDSAQFPGGVNLGVNGLSLPGVDVSRDGVYAPGVDITPNGIYTNGGVQVSPQGIRGPGFDIGTGILRELSRGGYRGYRGSGANTGFRILRSIFR